MSSRCNVGWWAVRGGRWGEGVLGADVGDAAVSWGDDGGEWPTGTAARLCGCVAPLRHVSPSSGAMGMGRRSLHITQPTGLVCCGRGCCWSGCLSRAWRRSPVLILFFVLYLAYRTRQASPHPNHRPARPYHPPHPSKAGSQSSARQALAAPPPCACSSWTSPHEGAPA